MEKVVRSLERREARRGSHRRGGRLASSRQVLYGISSRAKGGGKEGRCAGAGEGPVQRRDQVSPRIERGSQQKLEQGTADSPRLATWTLLKTRTRTWAGQPDSDVLSLQSDGGRRGEEDKT